LDIAKPSTLSNIPPWQLRKPEVDTSLSEYKKSNTNPAVFKQKLFKLKQTKPSTIEIYTDQGKVTAAAVTKNEIFSARLPNEASIFTAEAKAIQLAFEYKRISSNKHFTIFSDSLSCLQSIKNMNIDHTYILDIVKKYYLLTKQNKSVEFCWIPSHIGISGNTKADKAAKDALKYNIALFPLPYTDLKYLIKV
jgi:ribonuclease HI